MSSTTTKDLRLSQPKLGMVSARENTTPPLAHETTHEDGHIVVTIEIPGVDPETVDVNCENNILSVSCPRGNSTVPLDPSTDFSKIAADIKWGLLTITIPAPAAPPSLSIKVRTHDVVKTVESKTARKPGAKELTAVE